jgi:hypothetical protein
MHIFVNALCSLSIIIIQRFVSIESRNFIMEHQAGKRSRELSFHRGGIRGSGGGRGALGNSAGGLAEPGGIVVTFCDSPSRSRLLLIDPRFTSGFGILSKPSDPSNGSNADSVANVA